MPPTPIRRLLLSTLRRYVSTKIPPINLSQAQAANTTTKLSKPLQPGSLPSSEVQKHTGQRIPPTTTPHLWHLIQHKLYQPFWHPRYRRARTIIFNAPILFLAFLHVPWDAHNVVGSSMAPYFNTETMEDDSVTSVIIQRSKAWLPDFGGGFWTNPSATQEKSTEFFRGQIVTYCGPYEPNKLGVKRIVALPGDVVQPLPGYPGGDEPVVVQWNHVWVEGDCGERSKSLDSNWYGPLCQNMITGVVIATWPSWFKFIPVHWQHDTWPAREDGRVTENAIAEAAIDPDKVTYSKGWSDGSVALVLERMRRQPDQALYKFVSNPELRQETRRLYNNALFVKGVASSEQEKQLATELADEMEDLYGRDALVFGLQMKKQPRDRGQIPDFGGSKENAGSVRDQSASDAEKRLREQGWELERDATGVVKTHSAST